MNRTATALISLALVPPAVGADREPPAVAKVHDYSTLAANTWTLVHVEDNLGGKWGARAIYAPEADRVYLWGFGGERPQRNRYLRYELESFAPLEARWVEALPAGKADAWSDGRHPPFTIHGQHGPATGPTFPRDRILTPGTIIITVGLDRQRGQRHEKYRQDYQ